jgi:nucleoside 2-deoxyribosyltransferase
MPACFVIQPFDSDKYDKRFDDVFAPAIQDAGVDPYRVDRDHTVDVPIEAIEAGIRSAAVVFADITADNPNVWYELGVAFAMGKPVVMVCSKERTKYPFDIQHRSVISYRSDAPSDFASLRVTITERVKAMLAKGETIRQVADTEQVAPVAGLSQPELFVLSILAGSVMPTQESNVGVQQLKRDVERASHPTPCK